MDRYPAAFSSLLIRDIKSNTDFTDLAIPLMAYRIKFLLVSLIRSDTEEFEDLELSVSEFREYFEIPSWGGNQQDALEEAVSMLKSFRYKIGNNEILWLTYNSNVDGQNINICLHESLTPYLIGLNRNFTKLYYNNIKNLKSKYSLRLYEILSSMKGLGNYQLKLKSAYESVCDNIYKTKSEFIAHVLEPAIEEINNFTDLNVTYAFEKPFGVPEKIVFEIGNAKKIGKASATKSKTSAAKPKKASKTTYKSKIKKDNSSIDDAKSDLITLSAQESEELTDDYIIKELIRNEQLEDCEALF